VHGPNRMARRGHGKPRFVCARYQGGALARNTARAGLPAMAGGSHYRGAVTRWPVGGKPVTDDVAWKPRQMQLPETTVPPSQKPGHHRDVFQLPENEGRMLVDVTRLPLDGDRLRRPISTRHCLDVDDEAATRACAAQRERERSRRTLTWIHATCRRERFVESRARRQRHTWSAPCVS